MHAIAFCGCSPTTIEAAEDIEFVAEHLPEVAMDNRYATLPIFNEDAESTGSWSFASQAGYASTTTGNLSIAGPMISFGVGHRSNASWTLGSIVFLDVLDLSGGPDFRPLQTLFSPDTPIERPVDARFQNLDGEMRHYGLGGLELPRRGARWAISPHALIAWPVPRRGVVGHITGPGFDLRGNTEDVGNGKHFGDPSLTLGLSVTYVPAHLSFDVGALVSQRLLEPLIHDGVESNWLVSFQWWY